MFLSWQRIFSIKCLSRCQDMRVRGQKGYAAVRCKGSEGRGHPGNRDLTNTAQEDGLLNQYKRLLTWQIQLGSNGWTHVYSFFSLRLNITFINITFVGCMYVRQTDMSTYYMCMDTQPITKCGHQRTNSKNWFFPSTMRVPQMKPRP